LKTWVSLAAVLALAAPAIGAPDGAVPVSSASRAPVVAVTRHSGVFDGKTATYTATVRENFMKGPDGRPNATIVTTAYVRDDVGNRADRPVIFAYNGGPGASSTPLHFDAIGPVIRGKDAFSNNPHSLLDVADLVFIDPVGTGFSRNFTTAAGAQYWSRSGDAASVAEVIERWLKDNRRQSSPRYLVGESYGTVRSAIILRDFQKRLHFNGLVQVAIVAGQDKPDDGFLGDFPTMAATAWYWKKAAQDKTVAEAFEAAAAFARDVLAPAYAKGDALPAEEKRDVARRMSAMIGIPAETLVAKNLRLSKDDFMFALIADRGLRTGQLDTRVSSPLEGATRGAGGDPTMFGPGGLKRDGSQVIGIDEPNAPAEPDRPPTLNERYFRDTLKFNPPVKIYRGVNFDVNFVWKHEGSEDINRIVAKVMKDDPALRLVWTGGYYDLSTPPYAARVALARAGIPADRTQEILVAGPHSAFEGLDNKAVLAAALRKFVTKR
jgi:opacity protein-like surface antigen